MPRGWGRRRRSAASAAMRRADSDEEDYLRPPGELANVTNTPLSVADVLNRVPPFQLLAPITSTTTPR